MEPFIVSARKYRPQVFEDVVGQQAITNTLLNAIENDHLAQALLFTGPRGVGKTSCARILAKKINEQETGDTESDFAFNIFELDAASNNSVDDIRSLTDQVRIPPQTGKYKVYIIDEVHMLSQAAFNAFLKTLEEPPAHAIFILATTEKHKIIPTILSRCQIFDFKRITVLDAKNHLKKIAENEGVTAEDDALHIIAQKADGAMRDALSIYDRVVSFSGKNLTRDAVTQNLNVLDYDVYFETTDLLLENKIPEVLIAYNNVLTKGFEGQHYIAGLASHFRDLLVAKDPATVTLLEVGDNAKKKYLEQSQKADVNFLMTAIEKANTCDLQYKSSKNQRLLVELTLMQIASITFDGVKKKSSNFIIPASFFRKNEQQLQQTAAPKVAIQKPVTPSNTPSSTPERVPAPAPISREARQRRRSSALSLKSIHNKLEDNLVSEAEVDYSKMPKDSFTERDVLEGWKKYYFDLINEGEKNQASILNASKPIVQGLKITYKVPSKGMQATFMQSRPQLLTFLRQHLNNYSIELICEVSEIETKRYAYTPQEKFKKLAEINPDLLLLKETFGLDV